MSTKQKVFGEMLQSANFFIYVRVTVCLDRRILKYIRVYFTS
jgi:hypothetical protein